MRLIDCRTYEFEDFVQDVPPYAVLSHTWGRGEVVFADMMMAGDGDGDRARRERKPGWAKIRETCRVARERHGLDYAWVDTCCIDKGSSAELAECVNSMFAWYRDAAVCVAWLADFDFRHDDAGRLGLTDADVLAAFEAREQRAAERREEAYSDPPQLTGREVETRDRIRKSLGRCRWFTRGWTLQELIAPREVHFYDSQWTFFGTKVELAPILSWLTRIDLNVLRGSPLSDVLVGRRMSWASNRQTTRVEDMAYCLLGIFDINMPLLYGEGKKAFIRLQEEIIKSSNDLSIFAWTADLEDGRAFRGLWASCPAEFTSCQSLVRPSFEWNGRGEYSITSRGLRTTDMIRVGRGSSSRAGNYFMPLNCVDARNMKHLRFVSLRQYGPSLFVRRKPWLYDTFVDVDVYMASRLAEPQYICCRETPDLESLVRSSREDSIQIRFDEELFDGATVRTCPEADWDSRNAILLTYRRRHFWGMWKIRMAEGRGQEKQQQQQQLEQQSEQRPEGVCVVCVFSNGFLLFGIFTLHDLPLAFERSDLLPSQAEEILEEIPDRTSTRCAGWAHKIVEAAVDLAEEGDPVKIPGTMLQISSTRADDSQKGGNRVRRRIKQLLKKSTWPRGSASPQALPTKGTWPQ